MTVLVTGAAGFVGRHVVQELLRRGETVRALVRQPSQADELTALGAEGVVGDVRSLQEVAEAARGVSVVYHCAALVGHGRGQAHSKQDVYDVNLDGVRHVLEAIRQARSGRVIVLSSVNVLGSRSFDGANEDAPCHRTNEPHADVKIDAESLAADYRDAHGVDVCVLRPGLIYGPGEQNIPKILSAVQRGKFRFIGSKGNIVPLVHVSDLVQAMLLAAEKPVARGRTYHITDGSRTTIGELVDLMAGLSGAPKPDKTLPLGLLRVVCALFSLLGKIGVLRHPPITKVGLRFLGTSRFVEISRARQELGYAPRVAMREGITSYVRWLLDQSSHELANADAHAH